MADLLLELTPQRFAELFPQGGHLFVQLRLPLPAPGGNDEEAHCGHEASQKDTGHIGRRRRSQGRDQRTQTQCARLQGCRGGHRRPGMVGHGFRLPVPVIPVHHPPGFPGHRLHQPVPIVRVTSRAHVPDDSPVFLARPPGEMLMDGLPLAQVGFHQPIDQLVHFLFDLAGKVGHHLPFELLLDAGLAQEIEDPPEAEGLVEKNLTPLLHSHENVIDVGHAESEVALHILLIEFQLGFHVGQKIQVGFEGCLPGIHLAQVFFGEPGAHTQGV